MVEPTGAKRTEAALGTTESTEARSGIDAGSPGGSVAATMRTRDIDLYYGDFQAVQDVTMTVEPHKVTALIGSSGCGKTTFLRSLNRMHELTAGARVVGEITLDEQDIYANGIDPVKVRRLVGMVFQAPNPFPTMSIYENVAAGLSLASGRVKKSVKDEVVERSLRGAHLWNEVKDRLDGRARALRRPAAAPLHRPRDRGRARGAAHGRALLGARPGGHARDRGPDRRAESKYTIVIVTHNMQQAPRASDTTAFFNLEETASRAG